ncbi:MAG: FAD-binding oxidoreductase [Actinobacteria bacterium]|nr:FAD-binding oxidoreductase [Actinomycetota bacterium]
MTTTDLGTDTVRPTGLAEAREAVLDAGRGRTLAFRGGGTKAEWAPPGPDPELVVETGGMARLLSHDPADATASVQAGMPLARLQEELAAAGQWLAIDPPLAEEGATVGGVYAANDHGPSRHRYGAMLDLVIGVTVVTSDGAVARSGGKVIKNVAGYDLGKLFCGSLGTLGLVAELVVRLHPLPTASRTVRVPCDASEATDFTLALLVSPVVPTAVDWIGGARTGELRVRIQGLVDDSVSAQARTVRDLAGEHRLDSEVAAGDEERDQWESVRGLTGEPGETVLRAGTLPGQLGTALEALHRVTEPAGVHVRVRSHAGLGLHTVRLAGGEPADHASVTRSWRDAVVGLGGHVTVRRRREGVEVEGRAPPPEAQALMRAVKRRFDPDGRCATGRFVFGS